MTTQEWIELYNSNNFDVDLSGWQLQDKQGTITTFTIPASTKILANGFLFFKRPETNIMLNNDADGLNLITPGVKIVDSVDFVSAPLNLSYNKINSGWRWSTTLTPGAANIITAVAKTPSTGSGFSGLSKTTNSVKNNNITAAAADISQTANPEKNPSDFNGASPLFLFFITLAATIILASAVLFIKLKFKPKNP
ncbi:MAG: lamin tail domain-containing protein [Candidatus Staskawiczbacteria bacterium]